MKEQVVDLLKEVNDFIIVTVDKEKSPNIEKIEKLIFYNDGFYFVIKKNSSLYEDLKNNNSITIFKNNNEYELKLKGKIKFLDKPKRNDFLKSNEINNNTKLEVVRIKKALVELRNQNQEVNKISLDKTVSNSLKYSINSRCKTCNKCFKVCPYNAISKGKKKYSIDSNLCVNCGLCYKACPHDAIDKPL